MRVFGKTIMPLLIAAFTILASGCSIFSSGEKSNNHLQLLDLADHLAKNGIPVTQVQPINPTVYGAEGACAIQLADDKEIGVYKYDITVNKMAEDLAKFKRRGYATTLGLKFPVLVYGSFMLVGVEVNDYRDKITEAMKTFY